MSSIMSYGMASVFHQVEDAGDEVFVIVEDYGDSHYLINDMYDVVMSPTGYMDDRGYEYRIVYD